MITDSQLVHNGLKSLAAGILCLTGCLPLGPFTAGKPSQDVTTDEAPHKLNARQAADVQIALGRSLESHGDSAKAIDAYLLAVKNDPNRTDAYLRLAILKDQQAKFKESYEYYKKALQTSPGNPQIFCDMGYSLYLQRRWAEAETNYRQALSIKPDLLRAHNNLGLVLAHTDRLDEALAEFGKGGCSQSDSHVNVAFALALEHRWDEARTEYRTALTTNPKSEAARTGLSELDVLMTRTQSAKAGSETARSGLKPAGTTGYSSPALSQANSFFHVQANAN